MRMQVLILIPGLQLVVVRICIVLFADRLALYVAWVDEYDDSGDRKAFSFYVFHFPFVSLCFVAAVFFFIQIFSFLLRKDELGYIGK